MERPRWWIHSYKCWFIFLSEIEFRFWNSRSALVVNINIQSFPLFNPFCYFTHIKKRLNVSAWWLMLCRHPEPVKLTTPECWWAGGRGVGEEGCMGKTHTPLEWSHRVKERGEKRRPSIRRASVRLKHHKQVWVSVSLVGILKITTKSPPFKIGSHKYCEKKLNSLELKGPRALSFVLLWKMHMKKWNSSDLFPAVFKNRVEAI